MSDIEDEQQYNLKVIYEEALKRKKEEVEEEFKDEILLTYLGKEEYEKLSEPTLIMIKLAMTEYALYKTPN